jgi:hypothetical protein
MPVHPLCLELMPDFQPTLEVFWIVLEIFWISQTRHFIQLRTCWDSFQTWSQHIKDVLIEVYWVSHNLWLQITIFLESLVNPGSPGHWGRVTLQHTEAYWVTRAQVLGHPPAASLGQHRSDRCLSPVRSVTTSLQFLVILPSLFLECVNMSLI